MKINKNKYSYIVYQINVKGRFIVKTLYVDLDRYDAINYFNRIIKMWNYKPELLIVYTYDKKAV